jgi:hypothetical protein
MRIIILLAFIALTTACATKPYHYGTQLLAADKPLQPPMQQQFIVGEPHGFLDHSDWIWPGSWLAKLFLWDRRVDSHQISPQTIAYLSGYLAANELDDVQVLVNTYKPGNQWQRLFKNRSVGAGWRYTLGVLSVSFYTILPGRFFGGDAYNPYTNTIYLYSDIPAIALHEGGHAKDTAGRVYKGTHAAIYNIPFAPLYYEARASNDALSYLADQALPQQQRDGYRIMHPAYGTYVVGSVAGGTPGISLLGAIPGHISGAIAAARVKETGSKATEQKAEPASH